MDSLTISTNKNASATRRNSEDLRRRIRARSTTHWKSCSRMKTERQKRKPSELQKRSARRKRGRTGLL